MQLDRPLRVVTSALDGDVLAVLAQADSAFTVRQIGRILDEFSGEGIRKVLNRLVSQGIVHSELVGNVIAYRFNRDHLAAAAIKELASVRPRLLQRLSDMANRWLVQPRYAAVFGSAAHGRMSPDSDVDVLLVHANGVSELEWDTQVLDVRLNVARWTGNTVDVVSLSSAEVVERAREPYLRDLRLHALTFAGDRQWFDDTIRTADRAV